MCLQAEPRRGLETRSSDLRHKSGSHRRIHRCRSDKSLHGVLNLLLAADATVLIAALVLVLDEFEVVKPPVPF